MEEQHRIAAGPSQFDGSLPLFTADPFNTVGGRVQLQPFDTRNSAVELADDAFLATLIRNMIANRIHRGQEWTFGNDGLPLQTFNSNGTKFVWSSFHFPVNAVAEYPRDGAIPVVTRKVEKHEGEVRQFAIKARMTIEEVENEPMDQRGVRMIELISKQIAESAIETIGDEVLNTFMRARNTLAQAMNDRGYFEGMSVRDFFQHKTASSHVASDDGKFRLALARSEQLRAEFQMPKLDMIGVARQTSTLVAQDRSQMLIGGSKGVDRFESGPQSAGRYLDYTMYTVRPFNIEGQLRSTFHLNNEQRRAEFYTNWAPGQAASSNVVYGRQLFSSIMIYDEDVGAFTEITTQQMAQHAVNGAAKLASDKQSQKVWEETHPQNTDSKPQSTMERQLQKLGDASHYDGNGTLIPLEAELGRLDDSVYPNARYVIVRDDIHRETAGTLLWGRDCGRTFMGPTHAMAGGDQSDFSVNYSLQFQFGCAIIDDRAVQRLDDTTPLRYLGGKGTRWLTKEEYTKWVQGRFSLRQRKRGDMWCVMVGHEGTDRPKAESDVLKNGRHAFFTKEDFYLSIGRDAMYETGEEAWRIPGNATDCNGGASPGIHFARKYFDMDGPNGFDKKRKARTTYGAREYPCVNAIRGTVYRSPGVHGRRGEESFERLLITSGHETYDHGDCERSAEYRSGNVVRSSAVRIESAH